VLGYERLKGIDERNYTATQAHLKGIGCAFVFDRFEAEEMKRFLIANCRKINRLRSTVAHMWGLMYFRRAKEEEFERLIEEHVIIDRETKLKSEEDVKALNLELMLEDIAYS